MTLLALVEKLEALAEKATPGPYFAATDDAFDAPAHRNSGLALVDTGRESDWPIARLIEWHQAKFTEALDPDTVKTLCRALREAREEALEEAALLMAARSEQTKELPGNIWLVYSNTVSEIRALKSPPVIPAKEGV